MIELRLLGPTEVRRDGIGVESVLGQPKRLALLVYLALNHPGEFTRRDELLAVFWPERSEPRARNALRQALHFLRRRLGRNVIRTRGNGEVGLDPAGVRVDVHELVERAEAGDGGAVRSVYRGPLLDGFIVGELREFGAWLDGERTRLERLAWRAALDRGLALEAEGRSRDALELVRFAADLRPLNEESARALMRILHALGDRSGALQHYFWLEEQLDFEFGVAPESATSALLPALHAEPAERAGEAWPSETDPAVGPEAVASGSPDGPGSGSPPAAGNRGRRRLRRSWGVALLLAGAAVVVATRPDTDGEGPWRMVVLPFESLAPGDSTYFARGITEELMTRLGEVPGLTVVSGAGERRADPEPPDQVGRELGARYVLTGSVRLERAPGGMDRVRVIPRLLRARDGAQVWSQVYDAELSEIFGVQSRIAGRVAEAVGTTLGTDGESEAPTLDPEAYTFYLRGREFMAREWVGPSLRLAGAMFREAVAADPDFAAGWAAWSLALSELYHGGWERTSSTRDQAVEAANRALSLDPTGFHPRLAGAMIEYRIHGRADAAAAVLDELAAVRPRDPELLTVRGYVERSRGNWERMLEYQRRALALRPRAARGRGGLAWSLVRLRRYEEADELMRETLRLFPDMPGFYATAAWVRLTGWGDTDGARAILTESRVPPGHETFDFTWYHVHLFEGDPGAALRAADGEGGEALLNRAFVLGRLGRDREREAALDSARAVLQGTVDAIPDDAHSLSLLALALAGLGDPRAARAAMDAASAVAPRDLRVRERAVYVHIRLGEYAEATRLVAELLTGPSYLSPALVRLDPRFDPLRDLPAFQALLE